MRSRIDSAFANIVHIYTVPWMRIGPYMSGVAFGFAIDRLRKQSPSKLTFGSHDRLRRAYWIVTMAAFLMTLFVAFDKRTTFGRTLFPFVAAFGRHFIGALVGSVIAACALQCGGWFDRFLSARPFVHLNRLTYFGYLLNPVVVVALRAASESTAHYDVAAMVIFFFFF